MTAYRVNKISQVEKSQLSEFYKETYHKRYKSLTEESALEATNKLEISK